MRKKYTLLFRVWFGMLWMSAESKTQSNLQSPALRWNYLFKTECGEKFYSQSSFCINWERNFCVYLYEYLKRVTFRMKILILTTVNFLETFWYKTFHFKFHLKCQPWNERLKYVMHKCPFKVKRQSKIRIFVTLKTVLCDAFPLQIAQSREFEICWDSEIIDSNGLESAPIIIVSCNYLWMEQI